MFSGELKYLIAVFSLEHIIGITAWYLFGAIAGILSAVIVLFFGFIFPYFLLKYLIRKDGYLIKKLSEIIFN